MFALYRTLSLRYLRFRWGLNALVVLCIGLGVSVWVATSALYVEPRAVDPDQHQPHGGDRRSADYQ